MISNYLLDIEGTTTPIEFVHNVLFPYAGQKLGVYFSAHANDPALIADLAALRIEFEDDLRAGRFSGGWSGPDDAAAYAGWLINIDRKSPPLKSIQGRIWQEGYEQGELRGEVFGDVPPAMRRWREAGKSVAIFSSGSELAQRLLFRYSTAGDLSSLIDRFFDTRVGPKRDAHSYVRIAEELEVRVDQILFVSDIPEELTAAAEAGMQVRLSIRPGNPETGDARFQRITSFQQLP